jgi:hypothetical protein
VKKQPLQVVPPHFSFPQDWIAPADLYFLKAAEWQPFAPCRLGSKAPL